MEPSKRTGPLSHLRVLDMTQFLSGPYATQIFGDLGAHVIKVEPPVGDLTRQLPPYFRYEESLYYFSINRNKSSVVLDLKQEKGRDLLHKLALSCDIIVENFRPGVMARLGLDYAALAEIKPSLIWCSITGYGQDGPYRDHPAYDMIVQAMSGGMSLTGEPSGRPVRSGLPVGDVAAGLYGVIGILAALADCQRTGRGRFVDVAMLDCQIAMLSYQVAYHLMAGVVPDRQGTGHDSIPTYRSFVCGDKREIVITANTEKMWGRLCHVLDLESILDDARFKTNKERYFHRHELWPILERVFLSRASGDWVAKLIAAEIPAAVINTLDVSLRDPQLLHRSMVLEINGANGEVVKVAGNPIKFPDGPEFKSTFPPHLGENTTEILTDVLGLGKQEIECLVQEAVVGVRGHADVAV